MDQIDFTALYGTFDQDMEPIQVIDVSKIIIELFLSTGKITIPRKTNFKDLFFLTVSNETNFLQIQVRNRIYNIIDDDYHYNIVIDLADPKKYIKIIYYAYINRNSNWSAIVSGQLQDLKSYGLIDEADLHVHLTDSTGVFADVKDTIWNVCKNATIYISSENNFEYPGIKLVYDLAILDPDCIYIYLHTKGMSYNVQSRIGQEQMLLSGTFQNWRKNMEPFNQKNIHKIGLFPALEDLDSKLHAGSKGGWMWFNFWYARGSYIATCEKPEVKSFRWYFEDWLGGVQNSETLTRMDCSNIYKIPTRTDKTYFTALEALDGLWELFKNNSSNLS